MEPQPSARATVQRSQQDHGLQINRNTSSGIERIPLEHSYAEQLPQSALAVEGLEIAYAELASVPEKQAVVKSALRVENVAATPSKRVQIRIYAGLLVLAIIIVIVAVVTTLKSRTNRSKLGSNEEATAAATSGPTLSASPGPPNSSPGIPRSTSGAYNGTGLCVLRGDSVQIALFYQHYTGAIRVSRLPWNGAWLPYDSTQDLLVASGTRNGTPMATVGYGISGTFAWHVFYVDSSNRLRDTVHKENSTVWEPGLLAKADVEVSQTNRTGLAVSYASLYSDNPAHGTGCLLFYGGIDGLVHVITWHERNESWTDDFTFPESNGNAGFSSYLNDSISYLILVNSVGYLELWWKDFNPQNSSTCAWNRGSTSMVALQPNTSVILDQAGFCYAQYTNNTFAAIAVETDNLGLLTFADSIPADPIKGIPGSGISLFTTTEGQSGQLSISVFVQVNGSDVTQLQQTQSRGPWMQYALPVD